VLRHCKPSPATPL